MSKQPKETPVQPFLSEPSVTLIHTNKEYMTDAGTAFLGRYCIAMLLRASQKRRGGGLPSYIYIDECADYIANDPNVPTLLDQARKQNVGLILAHQRLGQLGSDVYDALANDAGTILASRVRDADQLAKWMRCKGDDITRCKTGEFMCFIRDQTEHAVKVKVPGFVLENMPEREYKARPGRPRTDPPPEPPRQKAWQRRPKYVPPTDASTDF